ncbi:MAG: winged helix-turn-helix transcriptional regulator [Sphingomonadales bacterium]|nr:winged helix-turn-helix transcriptional regulator [Sphingomonadales bacterium]MDE2567450.1 winged helix-turn-helix transcriptional regulator [Sphingomonadales bacterium]
MGQIGKDTSHHPWSGESPSGLLVDLLKLASLINAPMREGVADPAGLSRTELQILLGLAGEGSLAGHDLSEVMGLAPMNVSRALAALSEQGMVEPDGDHAGRRRKPMQLSESGRAKVSEFLPDMDGVAGMLFAGLSDAERASLQRLVRKVIARMSDWMGEHHPEIPRR